MGCIVMILMMVMWNSSEWWWFWFCECHSQFCLALILSCCSACLVNWWTPILLYSYATFCKIGVLFLSVVCSFCRSTCSVLVNVTDFSQRYTAQEQPCVLLSKVSLSHHGTKWAFHFPKCPVQSWQGDFFSLFFFPVETMDCLFFTFWTILPWENSRESATSRPRPNC